MGGTFALPSRVPASGTAVERAVAGLYRAHDWLTRSSAKGFCAPDSAWQFTAIDSHTEQNLYETARKMGITSLCPSYGFNVATSRLDIASLRFLPAVETNISHELERF